MIFGFIDESKTLNSVQTSWLGAAGALVCTLEKANMLFTVMMEEGSLDKLSAVIIDELHILSDPNRQASLAACVSGVARGFWEGTSRE